MESLTQLLLVILLAPLVGGLIAGLFGKKIGRSGAHWVTTILVGISLLCSLYVFKLFVFDHHAAVNKNLYTWAMIDHVKFSFGFLVDKLTVFMLLVVTFVSFAVHIYSIGYMADDPGYQRFFSYISGFTFAMLSIVLANNFLLLFFGWEGVGLVSYLLIGFWFKKEKSNYAALKAFLANRVGDLGFLLGIGAVLMYFGTVDYQATFNQMTHFAAQGHTIHMWGMVSWNAVTVMCLLLFAGAAGKSAQIPLHIWLEGSMEGPTPISALIHAATMVTAGVYMVCRLSPMFEYSQTALSVVMILGAATAFFMGVLGVVQNDIKRVIAYSTLSQLGYMMAGAGVSAFSLGMFHLMTHAAFKALLFLSAGSVIVAMHHEQDIRKMGRLGRKMPVTYVCMLIGGLALSAIPPFSGFFSKDLIIEAVGMSTNPGARIAYWLVAGGAFVTALYTFRMFFIVFHGKSRVPTELQSHVKESPLTILVPLIMLAIPALFAGMVFFEPALNNFFGKAVFVLPKYNVVAHLASEYKTPLQFFMHSFHTITFWFATSGIVLMWIFYVLCPAIPEWISKKFSWFHTFLIKKYFIDDTYDIVFGGLSRLFGTLFWKIGDLLIIDTGLVHGSAKSMRFFGSVLRKLQSGYLYHYALTMVIGLFVILGWFFLKG